MLKESIDPIYDFLQDRGNLSSEYQLVKNPDDLQAEEQSLINDYRQIELILQHLT
jgi:hypothetical protein